MQIDKTAVVTGGGLFTLDLSNVEICAELDPVPVWLEAGTLPNTVSIKTLHVDSTGEIPPEPDPEDDPKYLFFGRPTSHFGLGGAPPYIDGYPIGGPVTIAEV